jgi:hypothetical protein
MTHSAWGRTLVRKLAGKFSEALLQEVGEETLAEINYRNSLPEHRWRCATHDFCDSNMIMAAAFYELRGYEIEFIDHEDMLLWGAAWSLARADRFGQED